MKHKVRFYLTLGILLFVTLVNSLDKKISNIIDANTVSFLATECACDITISGADSGDYTVLATETICLQAGAVYTGTISLHGGTLENNATAPQTFTVSTNGTLTDGIINNYGTIQYTSSQNLNHGLTINNYGTLSFTNLSFNTTVEINNYDTITTNTYCNLNGILLNEGYISIGGDLISGNSSSFTNNGNFIANTLDIRAAWINRGLITSNGYAEFKSASTGTIDGGCLTTNAFTNRGTINGINCGNITINTLSSNTSAAVLSGDIAIIDLTPPATAPFLDTPNGTIGTGIVWSSCSSCTLPLSLEVCGNTIDDNNDGRTDEPYPGGIQNNLQLWLKAETGTNTPTNGNDITSWDDQSTNGYSANASLNSTDNPVYSTNAINFNPGIVFDGDYTDDFSDGLNLGSDYLYSQNEGMHVFVVCDPNVDSEQQNYVFDFGRNTIAGYGLNYSNSFFGSYSPSSQRHLAHPFGEEAALLELDIDFGVNRRELRNGSVFSTDPIAITAISTTNINEADDYQTGVQDINGPVSIGRKSASDAIVSNGGKIFNGAISEVIVINDSLSQNDKEKINSYLAIKYGLTLSHDYVSASGTNLKSVIDGYENDIFGIARDDCQGLYQKQSKSVEPDGIVTLSLGDIAANNQSNANSINTDEGFLLIGNDDLTVDTWSLIGGAAPTTYRINRTWKMDATNFNEVTTFTIDMDDADLDVANIPANGVGDYKIIFDIDGDFTNGGNVRTGLTNTTGSLYDVTLNPGSYEYFTIVYEMFVAEICGNTIDDNSDGRIDEPYPGGVQANMELWLKAETGTNTTIDGNDVTSWSDQSINGYSANADVNSTDDPIYASNAINFNPGVEFDGTYTDDFSDGLHLGSDYIYSTDAGMHIFVIANPYDPASGQYDMVYDFGGTVFDGLGFSWTSSILRYNTPTSHGGVSTFNMHNTGAIPSLLEYEIDFTNSQTLFKDGAVIQSDPIPSLTQITSAEIAEGDHYGTNANGDDTEGPVSIGRKSASQYLDGDRIFNGAISEVLVYSDRLSSVEKEKINSYLAIKYGIRIANNYVSSSGYTLKYLADGYANDIFGIARDDCSGLYQKQSKSVETDAIVTMSLNDFQNTNLANTGTFTDDESYLIAGNNGAAINATWPTAFIPGGYSIIDRIWRIRTKDYTETTKIIFDVDDSDFDLPALPANSNGSYYLIADTDNDFTNGGTTFNLLSLESGSTYSTTISTSTFNFFSIGILATEICDNGIDDDFDGLTDGLDSECCGAIAPLLNKN